MVDRRRARALAEDWLRAAEERGMPDAVLLDEHTRVEPYGWVYFYQSREHRETGSMRSMLAGNAPLLVLRETGAVHVLGTAHPIEHYLAAYRRPDVT